MIDNNSMFPLCIKYLNELIRINTVNPPGNEEEAAKYIYSALAEEGITSEIIPLGNNRANIVTFNSVPGIPILFSGHLDTVPAGDNWNTNPFVPSIQNDVLYGRGACDMKGGIACMMAAAVWASKRSDTLPFRLAFVADEEISGKGTHAFIDQYIHGKIQYVILGEPTQNQLHIAHRGAMRFHITITGTSCHASTPEAGVNAIENTSIILTAIQKTNQDFKLIKHDILPSPTVCCTMISAGIKDNVVPDKCVITIDCRPCFGDQPSFFINAIQEKINELGGLPEGISISFDNYINGSAGGVSIDSQIVHWARKKYLRAFCSEPIITCFPACCDLHHFTDAKIPALLYGPGSIKQAHTSNEFVALSELKKAFDFYCSCMIK